MLVWQWGSCGGGKKERRGPGDMCVVGMGSMGCDISWLQRRKGVIGMGFLVWDLSVGQDVKFWSILMSLKILKCHSHAQLSSVLTPLMLIPCSHTVSYSRTPSISQKSC